MAVNDFTVFEPVSSFGENGTIRHNVAANASGVGTVALGTYVKAFRAGEFACKALGAVTVSPMYTTSATGNTKPVVGTDYIVGLVVSGQGGGCSTETDTAAGIVDVMPIVPGCVYLGNSASPAAFGYNTTTGATTQATYDALVGKRVLIQLGAIGGIGTGTYASANYVMLATDGATYGCVIAPLDITKYPGKVAFQLRAGLSDVA